MERYVIGITGRCPAANTGYWFWKHELLVVPFSGRWAA
jgi:hypothetical protein